MKKTSKILISVIVLAFIIIAIILFFGTNSDKSYSEYRDINMEKRDLIVTEYDSLVDNYEISLIIESRDSVKIYEYNNLTDSTKNLEFRFLPFKDRLMTGPSELSLVRRDIEIENISFNQYQEQADDGIGPVFFNPDYGVLLFDNGWGKKFYFTDNESFQKTAFDSIFLNFSY